MEESWDSISKIRLDRRQLLNVGAGVAVTAFAAAEADSLRRGGGMARLAQAVALWMGNVEGDEEFSQLNRSQALYTLGVVMSDPSQGERGNEVIAQPRMVYALDTLLDEGLGRPRGVTDKWQGLVAQYLEQKNAFEKMAEPGVCKRLEKAQMAMMMLDVDNRRYRMGELSYSEVARYKIAQCAVWAMYWSAGGGEAGEMVAKIETLVGDETVESVISKITAGEVMELRKKGREILGGISSLLANLSESFFGYSELDRRYLNAVGLMIMAQAAGDKKNYHSGYNGSQMSFLAGADKVDLEMLKSINEWAKGLVDRAGIIPGIATGMIDGIYRYQLGLGHN